MYKCVAWDPSSLSPPPLSLPLSSEQESGFKGRVYGACSREGGKEGKEGEKTDCFLAHLTSCFDN